MFFAKLAIYSGKSFFELAQYTFPHLLMLEKYINIPSDSQVPDDTEGLVLAINEMVKRTGRKRFNLSEFVG